MDAQAFWDVIGQYNQDTVVIQVILLLVVVMGIIAVRIHKIAWMEKAVLGIVNLFIGIVFFGVYGTEPIQKFFAFPLYLICGILFCMRHFTIKRINRISLILYRLHWL